jgi:hypothetical protein
MSDRVSVMSREPGSKRALPCSSPVRRRETRATPSISQSLKKGASLNTAHDISYEVLGSYCLTFVI